MFIAPLFVIAKIWNQSRYPAIYEWSNKLWYLHTMEYYSAVKRTNAWYWNNFNRSPENYVEWKKPTSKGNLCMIPCNILKWQNYRDGEQISRCQILNDQVKERGVGDYKGYTRDSWMELFCILTTGSNHTSLHM